MAEAEPAVEADPQAMELGLNDLGWVGTDPHAAEVEAKRQYLRTHNGITGLEVFAPDQIDEITRVFYRDGFAVVRDALSADQLDYLRGGVDRVVHEMMSRDKHRVGNRGSHRYSFGGASLTGHQMHNPEWAMLIDLPTITPILTAIFGSAEYFARGGGGDFCLPGTIAYQALHSDMGDRRVIDLGGGRTSSFGSFKDPRGILTYRDLPCPYICCNFTMVDLNEVNGPIRQIPGTQHSHERMPTLEEEPEWMKLSTVCPAPAGSVVIRDVRAWHGGTPNLSNEVRALPNAEFYAPWFREPVQRSMPIELFETLSEHGKRICRPIVAAHDQPLRLGYHANMGGNPVRDGRNKRAR